MTSLLLESANLVSNPLDVAEQIMMDRDLAFDRPAEDELVAEVSGVWCNYRIWCAWQSEHEALTFSCTLESKLPVGARPRIYPLLAMVNEKLWLGHFDISSEDGTITYRHAILLKGGSCATAEQLEEILDLAITECERFYPAFQAVVWAGKPAKEALDSAVFETIGEA